MEAGTSPDAAADDTFDTTRIIARNAVLGMLIAGAITFVICVITGQRVVVALGVASMPALFAGPFVAGLLTVINYDTYQVKHGLDH
ncbi:MAG: hypothetical protein U0P45_01440 [Acidimicrobiales bacterium]